MNSTRCRHITKIEQVKQLSRQERQQLKEVTEQFSFRCNDYYLSLIDWNDPNDPIRKVIIPQVQELQQWGRLDASNEKKHTVLPGLEHKYNSTVLLLISNVCECTCRYCFRKRLFQKNRQEYLRDIPAALEYIKMRPGITNVLLSGGDPLALKTSKLANIVRQLREIDHIRVIRIGTKTPAFYPFRIINDPALLKMVETYSKPRRKIYFITHFVHPRELTDPAVQAVSLLQKAGAVIANQTPVIKAVNDNAQTMAQLFSKLSFVGAPVYYVFQCRPTAGNKCFMVPLEKAYEIIEQAKSQVSGLAKRVRFVMSHSSGKIEVVAVTQELIHFKYHRAAARRDSNRFMTFERNGSAYWFDDYDKVVSDCPDKLQLSTWPAK